MHLLNIVLPVFTLILIGYVARRRLNLEPRQFARLSLYVLSPALMLNAVLKAELAATEVWGIVIFGLGWTTAMVLITLVSGRLARLRPSARSALVLSSSFANSANFGLPVVTYAFGQAGFERAAVFVIYSSISMASLAVFFAAQSQAQRRREEEAAAESAVAAAGVAAQGGKRPEAGEPAGTTPARRPGSPPGRPVWVEALIASTRMPMIYGVMLGGLLRWLNLPVPTFLMRSLEMLTQVTLPLLLMILGMQLAVIQLRGAAVRIGLASFLRLVVSPLVAYGLVTLLGLDPLTGRVLVVEAAMPAAVNTMLVSMEFGADPEVVSSTALVTTGLSLITLTLVLGWVM